MSVRETIQKHKVGTHVALALHTFLLCLTRSLVRLFCVYVLWQLGKQQHSSDSHTKARAASQAMQCNWMLEHTARGLWIHGCVQSTCKPCASIALFLCFSFVSVSPIRFVQFKRSVSATVCFCYISLPLLLLSLTIPVNHTLLTIPIIFFSSLPLSLSSLIAQSTAALYSHHLGQLGSMCFFLHFVPHTERRTSIVFIHLAKIVCTVFKRYIVVAFKRLYSSQSHKKNSVHKYKHTSQSWPVCLACFQISNNVPHFFSSFFDYTFAISSHIHVSRCLSWRQRFLLLHDVVLFFLFVSHLNIVSVCDERLRYLGLSFVRWTSIQTAFFAADLPLR